MFRWHPFLLSSFIGVFSLRVGSLSVLLLHQDALVFFTAKLLVVFFDGLADIIEVEVGTSFVVSFVASVRSLGLADVVLCVGGTWLCFTLFGPLEHQESTALVGEVDPVWLRTHPSISLLLVAFERLLLLFC